MWRWRAIEGLKKQRLDETSYEETTEDRTNVEGVEM